MNKRISLHISFWILYILLKTYLNFEAGSAGNTQNATLSYFILSLKAQLPFLAVKIPLVYSLFNLSEQYLNGNKNLIQISAISILLFLISIVCFLFISNLIVLKYIYQVPSDLKSAFSPGSIIYTFFNLAFVSGIALALKLVRANLRQKENEQEIIKKKLETELQFLKAQTNPHFLFNTLNNIYALPGKNLMTPRMWL
ncbi:MAG: histidine kinase [Chitinophagaceae bacterium]|nr:histidine kinase [Chitinophagaceae bacterium]